MVWTRRAGVGAALLAVALVGCKVPPKQPKTGGTQPENVEVPAPKPVTFPHSQQELKQAFEAIAVPPADSLVLVTENATVTQFEELKAEVARIVDKHLAGLSESARRSHLLTAFIRSPSALRYNSHGRSKLKEAGVSEQQIADLIRLAGEAPKAKAAMKKENQARTDTFNGLRTRYAGLHGQVNRAVRELAEFTGQQPVTVKAQPVSETPSRALNVQEGMQRLAKREGTEPKFAAAMKAVYEMLSDNEPAVRQARAAAAAARREAWRRGPGGRAYARGYKVGSQRRKKHLGSPMMKVLQLDPVGTGLELAEKYGITPEHREDYMTGYVNGLQDQPNAAE